jgi:hypothetical protein
VNLGIDPRTSTAEFGKGTLALELKVCFTTNVAVTMMVPVVCRS